MQQASLEKLDASTRVKLRSTQILTSLPQIVSELIQNSLDAGASVVDIGIDWLVRLIGGDCIPISGCIVFRFQKFENILILITLTAVIIAVGRKDEIGGRVIDDKRFNIRHLGYLILQVYV